MQPFGLPFVPELQGTTARSEADLSTGSTGYADFIASCHIT